MADGREADQGIRKRILMIINTIVIAIGMCGGPLILRLYFNHGGNRLWLSSFLQTAGFPIILLPIFISYIIRHRAAVDGTKPKMITMEPPMFVASALVGLLLGVDNYLYSYGLARLPVSTSSLLVATQLAFMAIFAFFMVKQKFTAYSVNAVVLLTLGAGVLAMHASGDRPAGESDKQYVMGFIMTLLSAVIYGLFLPMVELMYKKARQGVTFSLVLEIQIVISLTAAIFCLIGMIINHDFKVIPREAKHYGLGETNYYVVLVASAIIWQLGFLGSLGIIFCASSLLCGVLLAVLLPIIEILAVIFYKEKFTAEKVVSLVISLWGFLSYFYGEFKQAKKRERTNVPETELPNP